MPVYLGTTQITALELGTTDQTTVYLGTTQVWSTVTGYSDDFNRADGVLGANWADAGGTTARDVIIASNRAAGAKPPTTGGTVNRSVWVTAFATNEHYAECDVFAGADTFIGGPCICGSTRALTGQDNCYSTRWTVATGAFAIFRAGTSVATGTVTTVTGTDRIRLQAKMVAGSFTVKAFINGVEKASYVDAAPFTGLYAGVQVRGPSTADNWAAGLTP